MCYELDILTLKQHGSKLNKSSQNYRLKKHEIIKRCIIISHAYLYIFTNEDNIKTRCLLGKFDKRNTKLHSDINLFN